MISENTRPVSLLLLRLKVALICCAPWLAYAAEVVQQHARRGAFDEVPAITWWFIAGFSLLGWTVSEVDKAAELWNTEGLTKYQVWKARLGLFKSVAASCAAGLLVYMLGSAAPKIFLRMIGVDAAGAEMPEMFLFVFISGAGYMGARWFAWLERKLFT